MYNEHIYTFVVVTDSGSFSKAAEKLFISTVSVMKQINSIENHVGVKLLNRTNQGVHLTPAGQVFYEEAKEIIHASDMAIQRVREIGGYSKQIIRVGTSLMRPCKVLMDLRAQIDTSNSPFQIEIIPFDDNPAGLNSMMASLGTQIDCYVGPCNSIQWLEQYKFYSLGFYKCCCAVPRKHRLAQKKKLRWNDLYGEHFMLVKRGESLIIDRIRDEIEKHHPQIHLVDTPHIYGTNVFNECEQHGYIMETLDIWADIHPGLVTIPMDWDYKMPYGIVYANTPSTVFEKFISILSSTHISK